MIENKDYSNFEVIIEEYSNQLGPQAVNLIFQIIHEYFNPHITFIIL
jgi:hypothetical protein